MTTAASNLKHAGAPSDADLEETLIKAARARSSSMRLTVYRILFGIGVLIVWQLSSGVLISDRDFSSPEEVFTRLWGWILDGTLLNHTWVTLKETLLGFLVGSVGGVFFGISLGLMRKTGDIVSPYIVGLNALPKLAMAPLFIIWFGIGLEMKIAMGASLVFFLVFLNAMAGVRQVEVEQVNSLRLLGASRWQLLVKLTLPASMTSIILGLKIAVPYALIGAVVGELIAATEGLGYVVTTASAQYDTGGVFACLFVLAILALFINQAVEEGEKWILKWKRTSN